MDLSVGQQLGPYRVAELIGAGGMGRVYRAHDPRVGRDVAIKVSSEGFTDRFLREAQAADHRRIELAGGSQEVNASVLV